MYVVEPTSFPFFKWQHRAGSGARARAEAKIREKVEPEQKLEPKKNNFGSVTLDEFILFFKSSW